MRKDVSYAEIVAERMIPKLLEGVEKGKVELDEEDCQRLLFHLRTAVPLEPFLTLFVQIINQTVADFMEGFDGTPKSENPLTGLVVETMTDFLGKKGAANGP